MNEHDSERIAGLLAAEGMEPADELESADIVVLNTCCIRENADNKLYGHLGQLKALKAERPDLEVVVGGCLAQKDRDLIRARAAHVVVGVGTHNVHRTVDLLQRSRHRRPQPLFADLLHAVAGVEGIRRLRFTSPHPKDLRPETIDAMAANPAICNHLHLPLQSGSDRILAAMHRGYTAERYLAKISAA